VWGQPRAVLEQFLLLIPFLAGKKAAMQQVRFDAFMRDLVQGQELPLEALRRVRHEQGHWVLVELLQKHRLGKYGSMGRMLRDVAEHPDILLAERDAIAESVAGFGMKSASMFVSFSRVDARVAVLDTHVLKWLNQPAPKTREQYLQTETLYLERCAAANQHPAIQDFQIWLAAQKPDNRALCLPWLERAQGLVR